MRKKIASVWSRISKLSWKKKILGIVILIILGIVYKSTHPNQPNYSYDTVTRQTITEVVTETGNVTVAGEYDIPSPSTGILSEIDVKNGDTVAVGQKLFKVMSTATPLQKTAALAAYNSAKSALDGATATLFSLQSTMFIANQKFVNDRGIDNPSTDQKNDPIYIEENATWLQAEANYKNQQGIIAGAQAALTNASLAYQATQDSVVTSPAAGTIHNLNGVVGSVVSSGPSSATPTTASPPVLIISTGNKYTISTVVNEVDINKIKVGSPVDITFDAIKDTTFHGKIIQTDEYGTNSQGVINFNAYSSVDNGNSLIKPGMTANLTIDTNRHEHVLSVINAAVRPYKGAKAVQVLKNGKLQYDRVTTGIKGLDRTEITSGVTEGEKVIIGNTTTPAASFTPGG
jgi:multidrug efflux pump subunit AcrA (membrane-fusion protein)